MPNRGPPTPPPVARPRPPAQPRSFATSPLTLEDQVRLSYFSPAPSSYYPKKGEDVGGRKLLGKISDSQIPSVHDYVPRSKAHVPGPGSYDTPDTRPFALPEGGRVNRAPPEKRLSQDPLLNEYPVPAPGEYGVPSDPSRPRQVYGKFGKDRRVSKYIVDEERRSRHVPGPGAHEVQEAMENVKPFCPEGGRTIAGSTKPTDYFDAAPKQYVAPGPGQYDLPPGIEVNKGNAKTIYRYESATIEETKRLMTRMCGDNNNAPGPGSYELPVPLPHTGVPALKGRQLPYAMPHPYAYNCAPDLGGKYTNLAPVREQNSGAQIFGTGQGGGGGGSTGAKTEKRATSSSSATRPAKQDADQVHSTRLPNNVGEVEVPDEEAVKWMSGGFASIKKSKSTGTIVRAEHPSIREAKKFYPVLGLRSGRAHDTFLPNKATRREPIYTHDGSRDYKRLARSKWQVKALQEGLRQATTSALQPLDLDKLKQDAVNALQSKARERMSMDGVSKDKQEQILGEMLGVLQEQSLVPNATSMEADPDLGPDPEATAEGNEARHDPPPVAVV